MTICSILPRTDAVGGNVPTGYRSVETESKTRSDGTKRKVHKLEIVEEEAEIIKLIFNKYLEFQSLTKVETYTLQNDIKTKNGNDFSRYTIKGILFNPVYMIADEQAWNYFNQLIWICIVINLSLTVFME